MPAGFRLAISAALTSTPYGKALIAKLVVLAVILAVAAVNLTVIERRLTRQPAGTSDAPWSGRLRWTLAAEVLGILILLGAVGQMTSLQPARDVVEASSRQVGYTVGQGDRSATLFIAPGIAGPNHVRVDIDGPLLPTDVEVLLRLRIPDNADLGTKEISLSRVAGNAFEHHGSELSIAADWEVTTIIREPGTSPLNLRHGPNRD